MGEWRYSSKILVLGIRWEWCASLPCRFTPGERVRATHWIGGWVGLRIGLNAIEERKILALPGIESRLSSP
jgi:hypothetical protein